MNGQIAIIPLTQLEEKLLDEAVSRGRFASRHDYLASALLEVIRGTLIGQPLNPVESPAALRVAEEPTPEGYTPQKGGAA